MPKTIVVPEGTQKPIAPYSPGALADGILYVSGTLPFDKNNDVVHVGDAAAQTRHVLETIKGVVEAAGGSMDDVTFNMIMLTDWANYTKVNEVYAEYFDHTGPTRTTVAVRELPHPHLLIEIQAVAVRRERV